MTVPPIMTLSMPCSFTLPNFAWFNFTKEYLDALSKVTHKSKQNLEYLISKRFLKKNYFSCKRKQFSTLYESICKYSRYICTFAIWCPTSISAAKNFAIGSKIKGNTIKCYSVKFHLTIYNLELVRRTICPLVKRRTVLWTFSKLMFMTACALIWVAIVKENCSHRETAKCFVGCSSVVSVKSF